MIADDYVHYDKQLRPGARIEINGGFLKWYALFREGQPIPEEADTSAREFLKQELDHDRLQLDGELGFVILHRCGSSFYFLLVSTWRSNNELWETVYFRDGGAFGLFPREGSHLPGYCVWELRAVGHEQQAFRRYLLSARDEAAKNSYRDDQLSATV